MTIENKFLLKVKKQLRENAPSLLSSGAAMYHRLFVFKLEKAYMKGKLAGELDEPSLILLSSNRAATQFVEDVLAKIYTSNGGKHIALNRYLYFFDRNGYSSYLDAAVMASYMKPRGFFYGQQGPFDEHEVFKGYKKVVMVRDPRDLLVSHYFSFTHAHVPRNKEFVDKIKKAKEMGIEKYVLLEEHVSYFRNCLEQAVTLRGQDDVLFYKYEDMMDDFNKFHEACQYFVNGEVNEDLSRELSSMYKKPAEGQKTDNTRHRRSGTWGQFKHALEPSTIDKLNAEFGALLDALDYPLS